MTRVGSLFPDAEGFLIILCQVINKSRRSSRYISADFGFTWCDQHSRSGGMAWPRRSCLAWPSTMGCYNPLGSLPFCRRCSTVHCLLRGVYYNIQCSSIHRHKPCVEHIIYMFDRVSMCLGVLQLSSHMQAASSSHVVRNAGHQSDPPPGMLPAKVPDDLLIHLRRLIDTVKCPSDKPTSCDLHQVSTSWR